MTLSAERIAEIARIASHSRGGDPIAIEFPPDELQPLPMFSDEWRELCRLALIGQRAVAAQRCAPATMSGSDSSPRMEWLGMMAVPDGLESKTDYIRASDVFPAPDSTEAREG